MLRPMAETDETTDLPDAADQTDADPVQPMIDPVTGQHGAGPISSGPAAPGRRKRWPVVAGVLILTIVALVLWVILKDHATL